MSSRRDIDDAALCQHCGAKGSAHRASDGKCPPSRAWGSPVPFPRFPRPANASAAAEAKAGAKYDKALQRYWSQATTHYSRMR
jgi:hypothetical protein